MITTKIQQIHSLDINGFKDCATVVQWSISAPIGMNGPDGEPMIESLYSSTQLSFPQENSSFTNYSDLTEEQVIRWISLSPEYIAAVEKLNYRIATRISPPKIKTLPWA